MRSRLLALLELLPLLLTVAAAVFLNTYEPVSHRSTESFLKWVVDILALVALSQLTSVHLPLVRLRGEVRRVAESVPSVSVAGRFLKERHAFPEFESRIAKAHELCLLGTSLHAILSYYFGALEEFVRRGGSLRVLVLDPTSVAVNVFAEGLYSIDSAGELKDDIHDAMAAASKLAARGAPKGSVDLRLMTHAPSTAMVMVDPSSAHAQIVAELYPFRVTALRRPHFELGPGDQPWFEFFRAQFESIWASASVWQLPPLDAAEGADSPSARGEGIA